jgi:hypothetical protein
MRVLITKGYYDRIMSRNVHKGEELSPISELRANQLVKAGVGEIVPEEADVLKARIAELEATLTERDAKITELEAALKKATK